MQCKLGKAYLVSQFEALPVHHGGVTAPGTWGRWSLCLQEKNREMYAGAQPAFSCLFCLASQPMERCPPHSEWVSEMINVTKFLGWNIKALESMVKVVNIF